MVSSYLLIGNTSMGITSAFASSTVEKSALLPAFLKNMTLEITPRQAEKLPLIAQHVAPGTSIFVALVDPSHLEDQFAAVAEIRRMGLEPVPHVPARFVKDADDLKSRIERLAKSGAVNRYLVLGGGAPDPIGDYNCAMQLMETGVFEANGAEALGIAGHPEGNADITKVHGEAMLMQALKEKQAYIHEAGMDGFISTQFLFEAKPVEVWAKALRVNGIDLPAYIGIPGPASIKTLAKYAAVCGVGNSARFIRKQALNITKLLSVSTPDKFMEGLADIHVNQPELKVMGPHMYPFGGFDKLFDWLGTLPR
jgi:methylenetetrahydrofolate reductase (NADPH)